jgi:hypothetical protein
MKLSLLILLALALPGVALASPRHAQPRPQPQQQVPDLTPEEEAALGGYLGCLDSAARSSDDGSDAATLGRAIAPTCRPDLEAAVEVFARGQSQEVHDAFLKRRLDEEILQATEIVQISRGQKPTAFDIAESTPAPAPEPAPVTAVAPTRIASAADTPSMSEWRRAYIAKHGHEPPAPRSK